MARPEVRDAVVQHATFSDSWEDVLPVIFAKDKSQEVVVVDPDDYIRMANGSQTYPEGSLVLVSGDVQVPSWSEDFSKPLKFPKAVIRGCLEIFNARDVREIDCVVTGWLSLTNCQGLEAVRGEVFSSANFNRVDLGRLGADFRCGGNLMVIDCPDFKMMNCEVSGGISVANSGLEKTGPAFRAGAGARIVNCPEMHSMSGVVDGLLEIERKGKAGVVREIDCRMLQANGGFRSKGVPTLGLTKALRRGNAGRARSDESKVERRLITGR